MTETCVCCGDEIPEGRMVCRMCEIKADEKEPVTPNRLFIMLNENAKEKGLVLSGQRHR